MNSLLGQPLSPVPTPVGRIVIFIIIIVNIFVIYHNERYYSTGLEMREMENLIF